MQGIVMLAAWMHQSERKRMLGQWPRLRLESLPLVGAQKTCCPRTRVPEPVRKQHYSDDRRLGHVEVRSGWCVCLSVPGKPISWWVPFGWRSVPKPLQGCCCQGAKFQSGRSRGLRTPPLVWTPVPPSASTFGRSIRQTQILTKRSSTSPR